MGPLVEEPKTAKKKSISRTSKKKTNKGDPQIKTIVMCGCGNHPVNPNKDPYMQHNKWAAQFHPGIESSRTDIRGVKGVGFSEKTPAKPSYDFSGEDFEVTSDELRKINGKQ